MELDKEKVLGGVRGYCAIFGVEIPRLFETQVIKKGAFKNWKGWIPIIYSHVMDMIPVGVAYHIEETDIGLYFEGIIFEGQASRELYDRIGQGVVDGVSFSAVIKKYEKDEEKDIFYVTEFGQGAEISPTIIPAMAETTVKTFDLTPDQIKGILAKNKI